MLAAACTAVWEGWRPETLLHLVGGQELRGEGGREGVREGKGERKRGMDGGREKGREGIQKKEEVREVECK